MSKQSKQYESMRQTQTNTFSDGLNMDLHPLTTPNTILTDCVNGTMITYNDNEFVLQNERGNTKIDEAALTSGFIPVAMKEHGGIIYIVSYNPQTKENEIGTFPSPKKSTIHNDLEFESNIIETEKCINYSEFTSEIQYYDYNLIISNYDKYQLKQTISNPLIILEHFILDENGISTKVPIISQENDGSEDEFIRFQYSGEGILGYKYRPYFISNLECKLTELRAANYSKLNIYCESEDEELYNNDDINSKYEIKIYLISENDGSELEYNPDLQFTSGMEINIDWNKTNILEHNISIPLEFEQSFIIKDKEYNHFNTYILENGSGNKYNKVKIVVTPQIEKNNNIVIFDNLSTTIITTVESVFIKPSYFTKFQYYPVNNTLTINATLDFKKMDPLWEEGKKYNVSLYSSYKLYEITDRNEIVGIDVKKKYTITHNIVSSIDNASNALDWVISETNEYNFKGTSGTINKTISINKDQDQITCIPLLKLENAKKVAYEKTETSYYAYILNDQEDIIKKYELGCNSELLDLIDEEINEIKGELNLIIENVPYEKNKFYILELTLNIDEQVYHPSFIIITDDYMLTLSTLPDRMDEIPLKEWFKRKPESVETKTRENISYSYNNSKSNKLPLEKLQACINNSSSETVNDILNSFFLRFDQLYSSDDINEVPEFKQTITTSTSVKTDNDYKYNIKMWTNQNESVYGTLDQNFYRTLSLNPSEVIKYKQTSKKNYLWNKFKDQNWECSFTTDECAGRNIKNGDISERIVSYQINDEWFMAHVQLLLTSPTFPNTTWYEVPYTINYLNWASPMAKSLINMDGVNRNKCYTSDTLDEFNAWVPYTGVTYKDIYYPIECISIDKHSSRWNVSESSKKLAYNFCMSAQHLFQKNLRGMMYSNIKENHPDVIFDGNNHKLWMYGKGPDEFYNLVAITTFNEESGGSISKKAWLELLKHGYIIESITPKDCYQYKYSETTTDNIEYVIDLIDKQDDLNEIINVIIYPIQCTVRLDDFDIQSLNNLITKDLIPEEYENYKNYKFDDWDQVYEDFLRGLGNLINKNTISANDLQRPIDPDPKSKQIRFDFDENWNEKRFNALGEQNSNTIQTPLPMYYDEINKIIYITKFPTSSINTIQHNGGCEWDSIEYTHLRWSYGIAFSEFWNIEADVLNNLNTYYSLDFYRSTNYGIE